MRDEIKALEGVSVAAVSGHRPPRRPKKSWRKCQEYLASRVISEEEALDRDR